MEARKPATIVLTVLAYMVTTFTIQGISHFVVNAQHYAAIPIMRPEPIIPLGLISMVVQGTLFALLFPEFNRGPAAVRNGLVFAWALGAFLASYIVLAEPGKYAVPSVGSWIGVEASVAFVQYSAFGVLLGLLHRRSAGSGASHLPW